MWHMRYMICALVLGFALTPGAFAQTVGGALQGEQLLSAGEKAMTKGQFDVAVQQFGRALRSNDLTTDQVALALYKRGVAHEQAGRPAQAIADITSALFLPNLSNTDRAQAYLSRGRAYEAVGMSDLSRSDISRARSGGADERQVARSSEPAQSGSSSPGAPAFATSSEPAGWRQSGPSFETRADSPSVSSRRQRVATFETQSRAAEEPIPQFRTTIAPQESSAPARQADTQVAARSAGNQASSWNTSASGDQEVSEQKDKPGSGVGRFFGNLWAKTKDGKEKQQTAAAPPTPVTPQRNQTTSAARAPQPSWDAQVSAPAQTSAPRPPAATVQPAAATGGSGYRIQLAALRSEAEAQATWKRLQSKHGKLLGGRQSSIVRTELGGLGTFYRVQLGPFSDKAASQQLCKDFKSGGLDCFLLSQ